MIPKREALRPLVQKKSIDAHFYGDLVLLVVGLSLSRGLLGDRSV